MEDYLYFCPNYGKQMNQSIEMGPTVGRERYVVLDALRGLALLGIALANFPEFGLWTFLSNEEQSFLPTATADHIVRFLQYMLVDGKFYTIFSLLFGIGFALFLSPWTFQSEDGVVGPHRGFASVVHLEWRHPVTVCYWWTIAYTLCRH